jgi:hypothetical protein
MGRLGLSPEACSSLAEERLARKYLASITRRAQLP